MRKLLSLSLICTFLCVLMFTACKKKEEETTPTPTPTGYSCATCTIAPDANVANDNASKGIYKGIIVGSSGTIKFDIMNNDTTIKAYMVLDGVSVTLTATVRWESGKSFVSPFTGTFNGEPISITFSVGADGSNPTVTTMSIPGHPNASLTLSKETSTNLVKCFEGTYKNTTTGKSGNFNLFLSVSLKKWSARAKEDGATQASPVEGTFDGTTLSFDNGKGTSGSAKLTGDNITGGTFKGDNGDAGTWEGKRTL